MSGDGQRRLDCPGGRQPASQVFAEPIRDPDGGQARQNISWYGRGACRVCGRGFGIDLQGRIRPHAARRGAS